MANNQRAYGAASATALQQSVDSAPPAGIGDAFSIERAAGRAIDQMRRTCIGIQLPSPAVITYVFCDNLEGFADPGVFEPINLVWTSDSSIQFNQIENRVILLSRSGGAGCQSKITYPNFSAQANAVASLGLCEASAVVFQLVSSQVTIYPLGITSNVFEHRPFGTVSKLLIGTELAETLDHFDDTWTNAPLGHAKVWSREKGHPDYVPAADTEKVIQEQMQLVLASVDRSGVVVQEIPNTEGRADLLLYSDMPGGRHQVVLELKVLRSFSFPSIRTDGKISTVSKTINTGNSEEVVKQAHRYRQTLLAQRACARLYDMRKPPLAKDVTASSEELAKTLDVELCISRIHISAKAKRDDKVAKELAEKSTKIAQL